jgi:integral membrane protein
MRSWFATPLDRFRFAAVAEALSWLGLLVGMLFKYVIVLDPIGVRIMGPIHGLLFVLYVIFTFEAMDHLRQPRRVLVIGLLAAIPPFTTLWFERWVLARAPRADDA